MISTVFVESVRPAGELPAYCYLLAESWIPVRVTRGRRTGLIIVTRLDRRSGTMRFSPTDMVVARIPESWEDARWDIGFDLMQKGII